MFGFPKRFALRQAISRPKRAHRRAQLADTDRHITSRRVERNHVEVERLAALSGQQADRRRDIELFAQTLEVIAQEDAQFGSVFRAQPIAQLLRGTVGIDQLMMAEDQNCDSEGIHDRVEPDSRAARRHACILLVLTGSEGFCSLQNLIR